MGTIVPPDEGDAPLAVDPDRVLPRPVPAQGLQPVARRHAEVLKSFGGIKRRQLAPRRKGELPRHAARQGALEDQRRRLVAEAPDPPADVPCNPGRVKRDKIGRLTMKPRSGRSSKRAVASCMATSASNELLTFRSQVGSVSLKKQTVRWEAQREAQEHNLAGSFNAFARMHAPPVKCNKIERTTKGDRRN